MAPRKSRSMDNRATRKHNHEVSWVFGVSVTRPFAFEGVPPAFGQPRSNMPYGSKTSTKSRYVKTFGVCTPSYW